MRHSKERYCGFRPIKEKIVSEGKFCFQKIRENHPNEKFYSFGLYTSGEMSYLIPTSATYEGLEQVAERYSKNKSYQDQSIESLMKDLKWSPCDSPLHEEGWQDFKLDEEMKELDEELKSLYNDSDDLKAYNSLWLAAEDCIIDALIEIDKSGVFGSENERSEALINFLKGDQDYEERIQFARRLNSPAQSESYVNETSI